MIKKLFILFFSLFGILALGGCSNQTTITTEIVQGICPNGVNGAPYCMQVEVNNTAGQTWITNSSFPISNLSFIINGAGNIQTPSTNQSAMDPNNCTGSSIAPGGNCTFYMKISFESYATTTTENINVTMNYNLNNSLFGDSSSTGSSSFTIYEVTNLYAAQSNGYVSIHNLTGSTNFFAESYGDPINTSASDTSSYGILYLGGNVGIYQVGYESQSYTSSSSISPDSFSGITTNLFTLSSNLYATPGMSVWTYGFSAATWSSSAVYTLGSNLQPNANAVSPGGVIYLATSNQVFTCGSGATTTTSCQTDGVATAYSGGPGTINAIAFPNSGSAPYTGFYVGGAGGLFTESGTLNSPANTWVAVQNSNGGSLPASITSMVSYNNTLFAGDSSGNIWMVGNNYPPVAQQIATVNGGSITAMTVDQIGGVLYFAATSGSLSNLYGCTISQGTCSPEQSQSSLYPVVSLSIASQLVTSL